MRGHVQKAIVLFILVAVLLGATTVMAKSNGITGKTDTGCSCHSSSESSLIDPKISGLPEKYDLGGVYELEIRYTGGDVGGGNAIAGFNLKVEEGTLSIPDGTTTIRIDSSSREATHTSQGSMNNVWTIIWTAPDSPKGNLDFALVVNDVDGDGGASDGDQWGKVEYTVKGDTAPITYVIIVVVVAVGAAVATLVALPRIRKKRVAAAPRPPEKSGKNRRRRRED